MPQDENQTRNTTRGGRRQATSTPPSRNSQQKPPDLSEFSPEQQDLGQILANVGVWPRTIPRLLRRYSPERIRANFQLFRTRSAEERIANRGAWLYAAITQGYALPACKDEGASSQNGSSPSLEHRAVISEEKKNAYLADGISSQRFGRCLAGDRDPRVNWFLYWDPAHGDPPWEQ